MKLLFLDIDGVLNTKYERQINGIDYIDDQKTRRLQNIVKKTGCKIVLSSAWRLDDADLKMVEDQLARYGMELFGTTPDTLSGGRGVEIKRYLSRFDEIPEFVIVDDVVWDMRGIPEFEGRVVQTDDDELDSGLQASHMHDIIKILGGDQR